MGGRGAATPTSSSIDTGSRNEEQGYAKTNVAKPNTARDRPSVIVRAARADWSK